MHATGYRGTPNNKVVIHYGRESTLLNHAAQYNKIKAAVWFTPSRSQVSSGAEARRVTFAG